MEGEPDAENEKTEGVLDVEKEKAGEEPDAE